MTFRSTVCKHLVPDMARCPSCTEERRDERIAQIERELEELRAQLREQEPAPLWMHIVARWLL